MTTPAPTVETIAKVKENLRRMQAFNDYTYNHGYALIGNCYLLMSLDDNNDPGVPVGVRLLESGFSTLASTLGGTAGSVAAAIMCHIVDGWYKVTPVSLQQTFASMVIRYEQSSVQFDQDVAVYMADPAAHWDDVFEWQGTTCTLGDLATFDFPAEGDESFYPAVNAALKSLDACIWQTVLSANCQVTLWLQGANTLQLSDKTDPAAWAQSFIAKNPSYYVTWEWHAKSGFMDSDHWNVNEYNVGFSATKHEDGAISTPACQYLFIDSTDNTTINPNGVAHRKTVFTEWGLRSATILEASVAVSAE